MTDIAHIKKLLEKATQSGGWEWEKLSVDDDGYIRVPACSYLGETMICLADTYEGSGNDCALISALLNAAPALIAAWEDAERLRAALNHQRSALALIRDRQCHDGVCTIALTDLEQGIRQIDAAITKERSNGR